MVTNGKYPVSPSGLLPDRICGKQGIPIQYKRAITGKGEFFVFSGSNAAPVIAGVYDKSPKPVIIKSAKVNTAKFCIKESGNSWEGTKNLKQTSCVNIIYYSDQSSGTIRNRKQDLKNRETGIMIDTGGTQIQISGCTLCLFKEKSRNNTDMIPSYITSYFRLVIQMIGFD